MYLYKTAVFVIFLVFSHFAAAEVAVIVNKGNSSELNKATIKRMYLNKIKAFPSGVSLKTAGLTATDPITGEFYKQVLGKSAAQLKAYWSKALFTGVGVPPKELESSEAVIELVKSDESVIAFIDSAKVTEDVRVVATF
ncbi:phosphate ABC transporter substrate-binding protein [Catenovulum sp. SM1970]|uniref:phosphate ABC transporter substrate-binding protein n=1 Tax=Marinifaba aquimaris TaxID=2741323 RepID=UPI001572A02B|nr:phosphate ABC transporter substrate-binding protein [Marinifaba aquimaris]NTS78365.1 phosphate ABC transporter substrate-binding protein [Marinifaba aquimaris]